MQKITPCLWFDGKAEEAARFYTSVFKNSKMGAITRYGDTVPGKKGSGIGNENRNGHGNGYGHGDGIAVLIDAGRRSQHDDFDIRIVPVLALELRSFHGG